jgi:hypothetical protein
MNLTVEQLRGLAKLERDMDSGEQPFVVSGGERWAFSQDLLDECGVESGQTVSDGMICTLLKMSIANLQARIALEKAANSEPGGPE